MLSNHLSHAPWVVVIAWLLANAQNSAAEPEAPPEGPYGYSLIRTSQDKDLDLDLFLSNESCAVCHERQFKEMKGSMHSVAHHDPLYRSLAEIARKEAGPETYAYCSGCHSPAGVVTGLIPKVAEEDLPESAKAGVTCDVCHQITELTGDGGPWKEPGNASFVLHQELTSDGLVKFGATGQTAANRLHVSHQREFFKKSEYCASCHTVIHPAHGLRIEHTYGEWKASIYAEKGIQCQDCHMRSVEDAVKVAETLKPVTVEGAFVRDGETRPIAPHFFVGGNANADVLADGKMHAEMAEARLKSAAKLEVEAPAQAAAGTQVPLQITVHNVAAGHDIPTGVTELRQMWVGLRLLDPDGKELYHDDGLDDHKELRAGVLRYGSVALNDQGKETFRLWETKEFLWKKTVPPKGSLTDEVHLTIPKTLAGSVTIEATLYYRSVAPHIVAEIMPESGFNPKIITMTTATAPLAVTPAADAGAADAPAAPKPEQAAQAVMKPTAPPAPAEPATPASETAAAPSASAEPAESAAPGTESAPPTTAQPAEEPEKPAAAEPSQPQYDSSVIVIFSDEDAAKLDKSKTIWSLSLVGPKVTNKTLQELAGLAGVGLLSIEHTEITSPGLKHLEGIKSIKSLRIWQSDLTSSATAYLSGVADLEFVDLSGTDLAGRAIEPLGQLKQLRSLALGRKVTDEDMARLARLTQLESLDLRQCRLLTDAAVETLSKLTQLKQIWLPSGISQTGQATLREKLPQCQLKR